MPDGCSTTDSAAEPLGPATQGEVGAGVPCRTRVHCSILGINTSGVVASWRGVFLWDLRLGICAFSPAPSTFLGGGAAHGRPTSADHCGVHYPVAAVWLRRSHQCPVHRPPAGQHFGSAVRLRGLRATHSSIGRRRCASQRMSCPEWQGLQGPSAWAISGRLCEVAPRLFPEGGITAGLSL